MENTSKVHKSQIRSSFESLGVAGLTAATPSAEFPDTKVLNGVTQSWARILVFCAFQIDVPWGSSVERFMEVAQSDCTVAFLSNWILFADH